MKAEKALSLIMAAVMPVPFIIAGFVSAYGVLKPVVFLIGIACGGLSWLLGQLFGAILKKANGKKVYMARAASVFMGVVIFFGAEIGVFSFGVGSLGFLLLPLGMIFWYWFGFRVGSRQEPVLNMVMGFYMVEVCFMYPICLSFENKNNYASMSILIITAFLTVCGALLINRRQLNNMSLRGKSENNLLTKATSRFNIRSTLVFCGIVLFAFFFAGFGAKWLWEFLRWGIRLIIYFLSLLHFAMTDNFDPGKDDNDGIPPEIIQNDNTFWKIFTVIALIALVIIFFKPFVKLMKNLYRYIMEKLGKKTDETAFINYVDIYQSSDTGRSLKSAYRKALKQFSREKDLGKKFRLGYKAFMIRIEESEEGLTPSDTAKIHMEKGRRITQSSYLQPAVEIYCQVRYNDYTATQSDCGVISGLLKDLKSSR